MEISPYSKVILKEATKRGIKYIPIGEDGTFFMLKKGKKHTFINQSLTELVSNTSFAITANKYLTNFYLRKNGFPVPEAKLVKTFKEARKFLMKHKKIVVKPISGNRGTGITVGVKTQKGLKKAIEFALEAVPRFKKKNKFKVVLERAVPGDDHRILVVDYKKVYAIHKIPAYVVGDGESTIQQLIEEKNKEKKRHKNPIIIDDTLIHVLDRQKLNLEDVPEEGDNIFVRRTANLATGGESRDITDEINPKIVGMAINAAKSLRMPVAGFDFMCRDYREAKGYFIEINPIPGFLIHHYPHKGKRRNPSKDLIDLLFKEKLL